MMLGEAETVGAGWRWGNQFLERIRSVTPQDIQRVARRYLNADNRTVGILVPVPPKQQQSSSSVPALHRRS
jgi:zinc protease